MPWPKTKGHILIFFKKCWADITMGLKIGGYCHKQLYRKFKCLSQIIIIQNLSYYHLFQYVIRFNPLIKGGAVRPPPVVFCPLLKNSSGYPYMKILDFSQLLVTPWIFFSTNFVYTLWQHFWDTQYKNIFKVFRR